MNKHCTLVSMSQGLYTDAHTHTHIYTRVNSSRGTTKYTRGHNPFVVYPLQNMRGRERKREQRERGLFFARRHPLFKNTHSRRTDFNSSSRSSPMVFPLLIERERESAAQIGLKYSIIISFASCVKGSRTTRFTGRISSML